MITFGITHFRSRQDGVFARVEEITWDDFVKFILEGHQESAEKETVPLFNATRFKTVEEAAESNRDSVRYDRHSDQTIVRRLKENVVAVELLILDYDGKMKLEEAKERFKDWEHVGYTSFGHLSKPGQHKFRLILPLTEPIPAYTRRDDRGNVETGEFYELSEAILNFAGECDLVVLQPNQAYYVPSAPPDRIHLAESWQHHGDVLDWTRWERNQLPKSSDHNGNLPTTAKGTINRQLDPNQPFSRQKGGVVLAKEATKRRITDIICPFHADDKGSEFLIKYDNGVICFRCKNCGTFTMQSSGDQVLKLPIKKSTAEEVEPLDVASETVLNRYADARDRSRVSKVLSKARQKIIDGIWKQFPEPHVIYLPEGSGKSRLALELAGDSRADRIIFACKSWDQVFEKFESFKKELATQGKSAVIALSAEGRLRKRFQMGYQREPAAGFRVGKVCVAESIAEIQAAHPKLSPELIRVTYHFLGGDPDRFMDIVYRAENAAGKGGKTKKGKDDPYVINPFDPDCLDPSPAIIFTTIARLRLLRAINEYVPKNWLLWIDDPDIDEFLDIKPLKPGEDTKDEGSKTKIIDGTRYHRRNSGQRLVSALRWQNCIYTTTEKLTLRLMDRAFRLANIQCHIHGDRERLADGHVTLLGTSAVRKRRDAIIPLMVRRLAKEKHETLLIAEGIPADFNHSTSKGRNDLDECDIIVELSQPHREQVKTICDQLSIDFEEERDTIAKELMLDKLHQAVGRNSGYRHKGFNCVVLADDKAHAYLTKNCSYWIDTANSVIIDRTAKMRRDEKRITESASPLVKKIEDYINNFARYIEKDKQIRSDFNDVIKRLEDPVKRENYVVRLLHALTSYARVDVLPSSGSVEVNATTQKFIEFANWIIDRFDQDLRDRIVYEYQSERLPTG